MVGDSTSRSLLVAIRRDGWTDRNIRRFEMEYGGLVRQMIGAHLRKLGLVRGRIDPASIAKLSDRLQEAFSSSLSSFWEKLLGGLVEDYLAGVEAGRIGQQFIPYVTGVIRYIVIHEARELGLLPRETPLDLLKAICRNREHQGRGRESIAWAKFCLEERVKAELIARCSSDRLFHLHTGVHRAADFIFERFIPGQCAKLAALGKRALERLIEEFLDGGEFEQGIAYEGSVTPYRVRWIQGDVESIESMEETSIGDADAPDASTGTHQESAPLAQFQETRLALWDLLLRGVHVSAEAAQGELFPLTRATFTTDTESSILLLAAVNVISTGSTAVRRNLQAALRYWFSRQGTKHRPHQLNPRKDLEGAGVVQIMGLYLTWREAQESVGGNPSDYTALERITEAIRREYVAQWTRLCGSPPSGLPLGGSA